MKKTIQQFFVIIFALTISNSFLQAEYIDAVPAAEKHDWMELQSGEWLQGEFKEYYSGDVIFDSDEMDLLTFSVRDVRQIITKGYVTISIEREISFSGISLDDSPFDVRAGKLNFHDKKFYLTEPDGTTMEIEPSKISSIIGGEPKESNYWSASVFLGMDFYTGNTNQTTVTAKADVQRRTALTRFLADYLGNFTEVDDNKTTANNDRVNSSFDLYQTSNFYWRLGFVQYLHDPFQNIRNKYTAGVGVGYDIINTPKTDWSITAGPGYQYNQFDQVDANASETATTALVFLDSRFDTELTSTIDFIINYNMFILNEESGSYVHHAEVTLQTELIKDFDLDLSMFWDRTNDPIAFGDGTYPKQDDVKTMLSFGYSY